MMLSVRRGGGPVSAGAEYPALHPHPLPPTPRRRRQQQQPLSVVINSLLLNPLEVDEGTRLEIAQQRYNAGDYRAALEHCNAVYMANPRRLENLLLLGAVYYQRELDMCITKNEEAVAIQPNFPECFNNMANAWREKGDVDRAIQFYEYAIKLLGVPGTGGSSTPSMVGSVKQWQKSDPQKSKDTWSKLAIATSVLENQLRNLNKLAEDHWEVYESVVWSCGHVFISRAGRYILQLLNIAVPVLSAPALHVSGFGASCSRIWQRSSYWSTRQSRGTMSGKRQHLYISSTYKILADKVVRVTLVLTLDSDKKPFFDSKRSNSSNFSAASSHSMERHPDMQRGISLLKLIGCHEAAEAHNISMEHLIASCWLFACNVDVNECKAKGSKVAQVVKVCKLGCN